MQNFIQRVERRAVVKKKDSYIASFRIWSEVVPSEEMDAEMEEERKKLNPLGPGGLDPLEASARSERSGCQALLPRKTRGLRDTASRDAETWLPWFFVGSGMSWFLEIAVGILSPCVAFCRPYGRFLFSECEAIKPGHTQAACFSTRPLLRTGFAPCGLVQLSDPCAKSCHDMSS